MELDLAEIKTVGSQMLHRPNVLERSEKHKRKNLSISYNSDPIGISDHQI